jgi:DNA-binding NarL/FixJ family response regulator
MTKSKRGKCSSCHKWNYVTSHDDIEYFCKRCIRNYGYHSTNDKTAVESLLKLSSTSTSSPSVPSSSPTSPIHSRRKWIDRWRCIVYHADGCSMNEIMERLHTTRKTIKRWVECHNNSASENQSIEAIIFC